VTGRLDPEDRGPLAALILAGERGGENPVAQAAGVSEKCWAPVAGVPMVLRVVDTLSQCGAVGRIAISLQVGAAEADRDALARRAAGLELTLLPSGASPTASILEAVGALEDPYPLIVTTADHPLLNAEMVEHFWAACEGADADGSGANLFALTRPEGLRAVEFWQRVERSRKRPWRLVGAFGLGPLLAYLFGRLTVERAAREASRIFGAKADIVDLPFAEAAIDVDKPSDLDLVERILRDREQGYVQAGAPL
jgi:GTP:adenosylcobinamide-phosphate guanylyltransferase